MYELLSLCHNTITSDVLLNNSYKFEWIPSLTLNVSFLLFNNLVLNSLRSYNVSCSLILNIFSSFSLRALNNFLFPIYFVFCFPSIKLFLLIFWICSVNIFLPIVSTQYWRLLRIFYILLFTFSLFNNTDSYIYILRFIFKVSIFYYYLLLHVYLQKGIIFLFVTEVTLLVLQWDFSSVICISK